MDNPVQDSVKNNPEIIEDLLGINKSKELDTNIFSVDARIIDQEQQQDKQVLDDGKNKDTENTL